MHKKKMEVDVTRARRRKIHVQDFPRQRPDRRRLRRRRSGPKYCDFVYLGFQNLFTEVKKNLRIRKVTNIQTHTSSRMFMSLAANQQISLCVHAGAAK